MRYFKDKNNQIYAYEDDVEEELLNQRIKKLSLTPLSKKELKELNKPYEPSSEELELAELDEQIKETENFIRHAILIGNDSVLPELRDEYKELLAQKQILEKGGESEKEN